MLFFSDRDAYVFWESHGQKCKPYAGFAKVLMRKLRMLEAAKELYDLRAPPGNRLEALHGDREGQYSIRINDQYRICFKWTEDGPQDIEITDYH